MLEVTLFTYLYDMFYYMSSTHEQSSVKALNEHVRGRSVCSITARLFCFPQTNWHIFDFDKGWATAINYTGTYLWTRKTISLLDIILDH